MNERKQTEKFQTCDSDFDDRLLDINEVSKLIRMTAGSIYHLVSQKRIPVVHISSRCIRFRKSDLLRWWDQLSENQKIGGHDNKK